MLFYLAHIKMKSVFFSWLFWLSVITDLVAVYFQWEDVRYVSKPLIVLSLLIYFIQQSQGIRGFPAYVKAALAFSIVGDVALLFENRDPLFFMAGLGSFLLAHILYIIAFLRIRTGQTAQSGQLPLRWFWIISVTAYLVILLYILMPYLNELKVPVIIYALVLCGMLLSVVHAFRSPYAKPGVICVAGALLFVISDSVLAINKFYFGFTLSGLVIMLTYACAQFFLVTGAARLLRSHQTAKFALHSAT
jgi:uncharacterized membrane protein YhhN